MGERQAQACEPALRHRPSFLLSAADPLGIACKQDNQRRAKSRSKGQDAEDTSINALARKALVPIERKLRGVQAGYVAPNQPAPTKEITVSNQVEALIQEATSPVNLARMYIGWGAYL